jgi:GNAT superfamily N-acetyltransferase
LLPADPARLDEILDGTYAIWGEGLSRHSYGAWNRAQMATKWGRDHLHRLALMDGGTLLASAKRYDLSAIVRSEAVPLLGIGAVFTPAERRGQGHARRLIELMIADAATRGCRYALLFSEIGTAYYESLGFRAVPRTLVTIDLVFKPGAPATLVRSAEAEDLPAIAAISARYREGAAFALDRSADQIAFFLARRRLLAGFSPAGQRAVELFVAEEGRRPVAYVFITRGPKGAVLEECGDNDPSGARVGAMLQVLSARTPAEPASRLQGWLPSSFRPPQIRITGETSSPEIMMIRPIGDAPWPIDDPATVVYWQSDAF